MLLEKFVMVDTKRLELFHCQEKIDDKFIKTKFNEIEKNFYKPDLNYLIPEPIAWVQWFELSIKFQISSSLGT